MASIDPKDYLWSNIRLLMGCGVDDPDPTVDSVQLRTGVGRGTVQRIKEGATSVGTDKLVQIAGKFGLEVWQLLVPGLKLHEDQAPEPEPAVSKWAMRLAVHFDDMLGDDRARQVGYNAAMVAIRNTNIAQPTASAAPVPPAKSQKQPG